MGIVADSSGIKHCDIGMGSSAGFGLRDDLQNAMAIVAECDIYQQRHPPKPFVSRVARLWFLVLVREESQGSAMGSLCARRNRDEGETEEEEEKEETPAPSGSSWDEGSLKAARGSWWQPQEEADRGEHSPLSPMPSIGMSQQRGLLLRAIAGRSTWSGEFERTDQ